MRPYARSVRRGRPCICRNSGGMTPGSTFDLAVAWCSRNFPTRRPMRTRLLAKCPPVSRCQRLASARSSAMNSSYSDTQKSHKRACATPTDRDNMGKEPAMRPTDTPLEDVLNRSTGPRRAEVQDLLDLFREVSGEEPVVWAGRIIGFGEYLYTYPSGHSGVAPRFAFAPGPSNHTVYLAQDFETRWPDLAMRLGKHRSSKVCLYLTRLSSVDMDALRQLIVLSDPAPQ